MRKWSHGVRSRLRGKGNRMDDAIRRVAALATVEKMYKICEGNLSDYHDLLVACFTDLPPAQQWIPCDERLPAPGVNVLVDVADIPAGGRFPLIDKICEGGEWLNCDGSEWLALAWMPIPDPWKGENDG